MLKAFAASKIKGLPVNKTSLLVVDDDPTIRQIVTLLLQDKYNVTACCNVDDAIEQWNLAKPELLLTDIEMGVRSGLDLIKHVRQFDQDIPIIVMSGALSAQLSCNYIESLGANKVVPKPFSILELTDLIGELLAGRNLVA